MVEIGIQQGNDTAQLMVHRGSLLKICPDTTDGIQTSFSGTIEKPKAFFTTHLHPAIKTPENKAFQKFQPDWILGILVLCFVILAWVQFFYPRRFRQILAAPFSKRYMSQLVREGKLLSERISIALGVIYVLIFPLVFYQAYVLMEEEKYSSTFPGVAVYMFLIILVLLFWMIKILLMKFLGTVFKTQQTTSEYLLNTMLFNFLTGVIMLPLLVFVIYLKSVFFLQVCLLITILIMVMTFFRGFLIGFSLPKFSYLLLFVYLCSLEILPLILMTKMFRLYF